jgi:hypothetical protein
VFKLHIVYAVTGIISLSSMFTVAAHKPTVVCTVCSCKRCPCRNRWTGTRAWATAATGGGPASMTARVTPTRTWSWGPSLGRAHSGRCTAACGTGRPLLSRCRPLLSDVDLLLGREGERERERERERETERKREREGGER